MNYKQAPGRNWDRGPRKRRPVQLGHDDERPGAGSPPSPVWYSLSNYEHAAGRNWSRPDRRPSDHGHRATTAPAAVGPLRERGGGDHDQPYEYRRPSSSCPLPFTLREYARLLALKSRLA